MTVILSVRVMERVSKRKKSFRFILSFTARLFYIFWEITASASSADFQNGSSRLPVRLPGTRSHFDLKNQTTKRDASQ
ncbi:MAG: hypothetical protein EA360_08460 [Balneolaceae bacterium]|nr:MAG: hypothetical protein EA360_08460 [Balneolaceae bacterium]